ncbi:germinal-center associated nuclear protein-like [Thamnophis elegans]|uniref:germinal-center associated nuclear protein-like n=1 Tax=Thamnophis elegans TaxID=35005 RepID=UPI001378EF44|nr:germinal-center associated nuclear protein-like [Thamnophis elegans]
MSPTSSPKVDDRMYEYMPAADLHFEMMKSQVECPELQPIDVVMHPAVLPSRRGLHPWCNSKSQLLPIKPYMAVGLVTCGTACLPCYPESLGIGWHTQFNSNNNNSSNNSHVFLSSRSKLKTTGKLYSPLLSPTEHCVSKEIKKNEELNISGRDLTLAVSEVDLLPECLSAKLQLEKVESKRFDEQLQQLLVEDSETLQDTLPLPLYLPESLVSMPQIIQPFTRIPKSRSPEVGTERRDIDSSLFGRLTLLKQLIKVNKEEETACEFHMSALLDMVDA